MARGRMFVDVAPLSSSFSVCLGTYFGALDKGVTEEYPSSGVLVLARVNAEGEAGMSLQMRKGEDAPPLQQRPRYRAALKGGMRPGRAFNPPNKPANNPATGHNILPTGPDL